MRALIWRIVYAVIVVLFLFAILPPLITLFGLSLGGGWPIIKICIGFGALLYVLTGPAPPAPF